MADTKSTHVGFTNEPSDKKLSSNNGYIDEKTLTDSSEFYDPSKESKLTRLGLTARSFTRAPGNTGGQVIEGTSAGKDLEQLRHDNPMLQQTMKDRHLSMIAVGGSIGAGLFVGSGSALTRGGAGGLVIAWILMGIMLLNVTQALGELAIMYPVSGGFYTLASRFIDPSVGMAVGWNYFMQWAATLPYELIVASFTIQFWDANFKVPLGVYITLFMLALLLITLFGTAGYAEEEFWSSCLKLTMIVIFLIAAIVFVNGGASEGPYSSYVGNRIWNNPGPFANGFKGVCSVFVTAAFSFAGTELIGLAATEHPNPRKALPAAVKGTIYRISIVFVASLTMVGLLLPYNDPDLLGGTGSNASPFVLVFVRGGVRGLANLMNAVIAISVLSIGLSCVYAGSRQMLSLAERGYAPKLFTRVDRAGRPTYAILAVVIFMPLAYAQISDDAGTEIFDWLLALSGLSTIMIWLSILVTHVRFRLAWKAQGHHIDELPFRAFGGIYGSILGIVFLCLVLIAQFYVALFPIGARDRTSREVALGFFKAYISAPIVLFFYLVALYWKRGKPQKLTEIDLVTGRKIWLTAEELNVWRARTKTWPWYKRVVRFLFLDRTTKSKEKHKNGPTVS